MLALALVLAVSPVYDAIDTATSDPALRLELRRVCLRESRCRAVGSHPRDGWAGRRMYEGALRRGWVDPDACPEHAASPSAAEWAPRGPFGVSPAYVVRFAPGCLPPEALDDPATSARLVVAWTRHLCRSAGACTCEARARVWAGTGTFRRRSRVRQLQTITGQCGPAPAWRWAHAWAADLAHGLASWLTDLLPSSKTPTGT